MYSDPYRVPSHSRLELLRCELGERFHSRAGLNSRTFKASAMEVFSDERSALLPALEVQPTLNVVRFEHVDDMPTVNRFRICVGVFVRPGCGSVGQRTTGLCGINDVRTRYGAYSSIVRVHFRDDWSDAIVGGNAIGSVFRDHTTGEVGGENGDEHAGGKRQCTERLSPLTEQAGSDADKGCNKERAVFNPLLLDREVEQQDKGGRQRPLECRVIQPCGCRRWLGAGGDAWWRALGQSSYTVIHCVCPQTKSYR